jgi:hypothetical protein
MANPVITVNDVGQIAIGECDVEHDTPWAAGGIDTLAAGTIMARITASGKWGIYDTGGVGGLGVAQGVLAYEVTAAGAGDVPVDVIVRGTVNLDRILQDDAGAVDAAVQDELRGNGILAKTVLQIAQEDNQP